MGMTKVKIDPKDLAEKFVGLCRLYGWTWSTSGTVVTVTRRFEKGDRVAYVQADGEAYELLDVCPRTKAGSVWGTDSGSVGGYVGLEGGYYRLNKSGVSARFIAALAKIGKVEQN